MPTSARSTTSPTPGPHRKAPESRQCQRCGRSAWWAIGPWPCGRHRPRRELEQSRDSLLAPLVHAGQVARAISGQAKPSGIAKALLQEDPGLGRRSPAAHRRVAQCQLGADPGSSPGDLEENRPSVASGIAQASRRRIPGPVANSEPRAAQSSPPFRLDRGPGARVGGRILSADRPLAHHEFGADRRKQRRDLERRGLGLAGRKARLARQLHPAAAAGGAARSEEPCQPPEPCSRDDCELGPGTSRAHGKEAEPTLRPGAGGAGRNLVGH